VAQKDGIGAAQCICKHPTIEVFEVELLFVGRIIWLWIELVYTRLALTYYIGVVVFGVGEMHIYDFDLRLCVCVPCIPHLPVPSRVCDLSEQLPCRVRTY
jgi:hypothetical protein